MNTVLIVDDEKEIRQKIKAAISRSGIPVRNIMECNNGQIALEILENQPVDVMFTDIRMPKMDGIELVEAMEKLEHKPLTVAVSGYADFTYAVRLLRMGVREYLLKPVERDEIAGILRKLDGEITMQENIRREIRAIGCQQLKYMILNDNITEKEVGTIIRLFEKRLLNREYVVCCLERQGEEPEENDNYLWLGEVEENEVFITRKENREFLLKNELEDSFVGVSRVHSGVSELKEAFAEAKAACRMAFLRMEKEVEYSGIVTEEQGSTDEETMRRIAQKIGNGNLSEALKMTEQFFHDIRRKKYSGDVLEKDIAILTDDIMHIYQNALAGEEERLLRFKNIWQFAQVEELMEELAGWMIEFRKKIDEKFDDYKNKSKVQQALAYIQENYHKDLSMTVVSNVVSMNYSMFSYAFKQYTGNNFVNYIKELRIKEAKRLLEETEMRVIEISQRVGYENEKHFMKIFKSQCGVSPTEYRKNMQFHVK